MKYSPRYRLFPTEEQRQAMDWQRDTVRQLYNHALREFNKIPEDAGTLRQRVWMVRDSIPELKDWWPDLKQVYSTVLQKAVERIRDNINSLGELKEQGYDVGALNWKAPREFRSFTYRQSGFELNKKSGPDGHALLQLKKLKGESREIPVRLHRDLPDHNGIKEVALKKDATGEWYASFTIDTDTPEKPEPGNIDAEDTVGLDLGVCNFIHDSDGRCVDRLNLSGDRERLEREQRSLSRKQKGSNNWEKQRQRVAEVHARMSNKKQDFKHKLAHFYTTEYDAVFVEDLDVKRMLESQQNARNKAEVGWRDFLTILEHHGDKNGCHVVEVEARGTTKECAECGVETAKPLWVREHSCPSCGFELDRDWNAALNVQQRGWNRLGVVHSEATPAETATAVDTLAVSASRVVETGSPCLKEAAQAAE
ncbi:IS1341-type transposase ISNph14 [Natronomonas pharaonis DSM 2160]|uniref:IS1341-type transposase ISNph14 n=1 Tax=Natronomonas pharaonis (strain ATCC 35678 / DSM 2160 / CIP 103997 / JCM 8858 / NBRC 14720 / NCIMB 2260 / Gabara) TaxID=348780 RepID=A0A1U7EYE7_NATPD|nr:RNA-guided endonuclease TnpB family protein [Natronomonas pharaonis]CAI50270.1 IS1341-type transposase ISNph14 [Natronomonas pharaonis DSM 2160]